MDLTTATESRDALKVLNAHYTIQSGRDHAQPIIHLFCRDADRQFRHIEVEGFRPHFGVKTSVLEDRPRDLLNDRHILHLEADLRGTDIDEYDHPDDPELCAEFLTDRSNGTTVEHNPDARVALDGTDVCTVYTVEPSHVGKIREYFDRTWEADVPFERRFLIDSGIHRGVLVGDDDRVRYENWPGHSNSDQQIREIEATTDPPAVDPRMLVVDIEVATGGGGVPDPDQARQPVTAITAYDSYESEYAVWVFQHNDWPDTTTEAVLQADIREQLDVNPDSLSVFEHEGKLLSDFVEWVNERNFDLFTGWNSDGFDYPYLVNRCYERSAYEIREWDRFGNPGAWKDEDSERMNLKIDGRITWDMLDAYKKTQYRDLRSYSLGHVATAELGFGKEPIEDIDAAWKHDPTTFTTYNVRDVQAVVEIEQESGLLQLYDNLRKFVGAAYETCNNNGPMIDTLFLRRAFEADIILTTNYAPDEGDYHGAHVFDPKPGVHENVVYPDLASLYPYIMWTLNVSPETLFTSREAYREAGYDDTDVFTAYVDNRDWYTVETGESFNADEIDQSQYKGVHDQSGSRKKTSGFDGIFSPQFDEIYFIKPDVKEGFIRSTVDLLVDMKYEYKDQKDLYAAVKRIVNSLYGTLGDSASGGKGFRLFDRRLGECITLTGQKVIKFTADKYVELINDYAEDAGHDRETYLVGGDTDSCQTAIPQAPDYQTALSWAQRASAAFQPDPETGAPGLYDTFMEDEFDVIHGQDEHKMDVEIESLGSSLFFMLDQDADREVAVKKRYAQHLIWDEKDGWLDTADPPRDESDRGYENAPADPEDRSTLKRRSNTTLTDYETGPLSEYDPTNHIGIKGFEYVRSDSATVTKEAQLQVLTDLLLADDYSDRIHDYLGELVDTIEAGEMAPEKIGRPKGISNQLDEYGWKSVAELRADSNYTVTDTDEDAGGRYVTTPAPTYRGAKYAADHFDWEDVGEDSKPIRFYVDKVRGDTYPAVYTYDDYPQDDRPDPPEVGRQVDAIAVENPEQLPDDVVLDWETMMEKELKDKLEPILATVGEHWDDVTGRGRQAGLGAF